MTGTFTNNSVLPFFNHQDILPHSFFFWQSFKKLVKVGQKNNFTLLTTGSEKSNTV